jgi:acetolactate synthase-1/2/3 large subunit
MRRTAAESLVATLAAYGVDRVFCVPGESHLPILDALLDTPRIRVITCRHEGGAGFMAVADAKIMGRPTVCLVSRGPGAMNAAIAVHTARQDAAPLVLLIGQVIREHRGLEALQEMDYRAVFGSVAKLALEVDEPDRAAEALAQALVTAQSGIPGPVVISLPEDMLGEETSAPLPAIMAARRPPVPAGAIEGTLARLAKAERPVMIVGGMLNDAASRAMLRRFSEARHVPVAPSFRHQDLFDNRHPNFAGYLGYKIPRSHVAELAEADLVIALGTRLGDVTTQGYVFPEMPRPRQPLIHILPDPDELGRVYRPEQAILADPVAFLAQLAATPAPNAPPTSARRAWLAHLRGVCDALMAWQPVEASDGLVFGEAIQALIPRVADDAVIITDAGTFTTWLHRYFPFKESQLMLAPVSGAMGFGIPAAVAAGLRFPGRQVLVLVGDGGFMMTGNEVATAVQYGVPLRILLAENGSFGSIRLNQERAYPGRVSATDIRNPDFAAMATAYGIGSVTVARREAVGPALEQLLAPGHSTMAIFRTSLRRLSAYASLPDRAKTIDRRTAREIIS